jgi:type IV secretion system protein VirB9
MKASIAIAAVALGALSVGPAHALQIPRSCGPDPSVVCVPYHENDVVQITLSPDVATVIALHPGETIPNAPMTDDANFEVKPFGGNNVMIRPQPAEVGHAPNLTLFAVEPDGAQRLYALSLVVTATGGPKIVRFVFPAELRKARQAEVVDAGKTREDERVKGRLSTAVYYPSGKSRVNWAYECRCGGGRDIVPDGMDDNGQSTVFRYAGVRVAPAFYTVASDGHETPITAVRSGELYIAPAVAEVWRLRSNSQVIEIRNRSYHPERAGWQTGTVSGDVIRELVPTRRAP